MEQVFYQSKRSKSIMSQVLGSQKSPSASTPRPQALRATDVVQHEKNLPNGNSPTLPRISSNSQVLKQQLPSSTPFRAFKAYTSTPSSLPSWSSTPSPTEKDPVTSHENTLPHSMLQTPSRASSLVRPPFRPSSEPPVDVQVEVTLGEKRSADVNPTDQRHDQPRVKKARPPKPRPFRATEHLPSTQQNTMPHLTREIGEPSLEAGVEMEHGEARSSDVNPTDQRHREARSSDVNPTDQRKDLPKTKKARPSRPRHLKSKDVPNWSDHITYDAKEEVLAVDAHGKHKLLSGPIKPGEVNDFENGLRCVVNFNEFNQPIRKGGFALVKYLGYLARNDRFCPVGDTTWHYLKTQYKVEMIEVVRSKFVIPTGELFDKAILMRVDKYWRQYKHHLKEKYYDPNKTKDEVQSKIPDGIYRDNWWKLVDYWYSEKAQRLSENGKKARGSLEFLHTTGCTSFANKREDYVEREKRPPSNLEFFEDTHTTVDGDYKSTNSQQFLEDAHERVADLVVTASPTKTVEDIENEVFDEMMYEGRPKRPVGYGFGVKQSTIFGVQGELRKKGHDVMGGNNPLEVKNLKATVGLMKEENDALRARIDQSNQILLEALNAIRTGQVSSEFIDSAQAALRTTNSQVGSAPSVHAVQHNVGDFPASSS